MLLFIVLSLTEADIAPLRYHGKEQHVGTKRCVSVSPTQFYPELGFTLGMSLGRIYVSDLWLLRDLGISNLLDF